jgi:hypothetical protein
MTLKKVVEFMLAWVALDVALAILYSLVRWRDEDER